MSDVSREVGHQRPTSLDMKQVGHCIGVNPLHHHLIDINHLEHRGVGWALSSSFIPDDFS